LIQTLKNYSVVYCDPKNCNFFSFHMSNKKRRILHWFQIWLNIWKKLHPKKLFTKNVSQTVIEVGKYPFSYTSTANNFLVSAFFFEIFSKVSKSA
jgi:hypothetical protein